MSTNGMTGREYHKKYGFRASQALAAGTLIDARRKMSSGLGLADELAKARAKNKRKKKQAVV